MPNQRQVFKSILDKWTLSSYNQSQAFLLSSFLLYGDSALILLWGDLLVNQKLYHYKGTEIQA